MMTEPCPCRNLPLAELQFSKLNRRDIDDATLQELAQSICQHGILEPIIVRPKDGRYEIVAGERRVRAAKLAELEVVPAMVRADLDDTAALELMIVENLQRENLNPVLEAEMLAALADLCGGAVPQAAQRIGRSTPYVRERLALLELPADVQLRIRKGELSLAHGTALADLAESPATVSHLAAQMSAQRAPAKELRRASAGKPPVGNLPMLRKSLDRFAERLRREAGGTLAWKRVSCAIEPETQVWVKVRRTEEGAFSGRVLQVRTFNGTIYPDRADWRVQFMDAGGVAWDEIERLADTAEIVRARR